MKKQVIGLAIAVLVAAGFGAGYVTGTSARQTETMTSTSTTTRVEGTATVLLGPPFPVASVETANVTVGGSPGAIGVDQNLARIYIADTSSRNLTVVDEYSKTVVATITLPASGVNGIATDYSTHMVYVLVDGAIVEINGSTDQVTGELPVGLGAMAYDVITQTIYGSHGLNLVGINVDTGAIIANLSLGYGANTVGVDPNTDTVFAAGCETIVLVCNSVVSVVNATSESLVATVHVDGGIYPTLTVNTNTDVAYVAGDSLAAVNGTNGDVIFNVNPQNCGMVGQNMAFVSMRDQLAVVSPNYNYVFVYDGATGSILDMYSLPSAPAYISYNVLTNELYVTLSSQLLAFGDVAGPGYMDTALVGSGLNCPLP